MCPDVRVLLAAPSARRIDTSDGTWFLATVRPDSLAATIESESTVAAVFEAFDADDATVLRIGDDGRLDAYRSVTATRNLYLVDVSGGPLVVADAFRNAVAELPVDRRSVAKSAIADHLLFRNPIEPETYVAEIEGVPHGTHLTDFGDERTRRTRIVESMGSGREIGPPTAERELEDLLDTVLQDLLAETNGTVATMFSGGVDSTLIHTYLEDEAGVVMSTDSPEFSFEREKAADAASMLSARTDEVSVPEGDFLDRLETTIDRLAMPGLFNQTVLTGAVFEQRDPSVFVNGEGADGLFGLPQSKGALVAAHCSPLFSIPGMDTLWKRTVGSVAPAASEIPDVAARLDRPVTGPESFAQQCPFYTEPSLVAEWIGGSLVEDRCRRQTDYVRVRTEETPDGQFARQIQLAHVLGTIRNNGLEQWRQLGFPHDHRMVAPFTTRRVADCAMAVPAETRYVGRRGGFTSKHILKSLLADRLPEYPVDAEKGAGALPIERYFESGPLSNVFDAYDPPSFVPESAYGDHVESYGPITWNLITYAIWRDRILENPDLTRLAGTAVFEQ